MRGAVHMQVTTIGLDLAKNVFQVHGIDATEKVVVRKHLRRGQVMAFFEALAPCLIGMEACATAHHAEFGRMCPQGIDQLSALAHQQIAYAMLHQPALLLGRFDRYKPHSWAPHRFADRLGVGGIVLVALDVGLYILRRPKPNLMSELRQLACPIMCRGAGFHADKARRQSFEELYHLAAAKLLPDDNLLGRVDAVNLEYVLGDIQTDRGNLHVDGSPHVIRLRRTTLADPEAAMSAVRK